jgi:FkbM family methyltransferase
MGVRHHLRELSAYAHDASSVGDFGRLMRVRLSLSKLGPLVCRTPITVAVHLRSFGPELLYLRSHTSDISVLNEQLISHGYESVLAHTKGARTIIDLGANTGIVARWLLARHAGARIVSVEPAAENLEILHLNLDVMGARAAIVAHCIGGTARPVSVGTTNGSWAYHMDDAAADVANSSVVTMDSVLELHGVDRIDLLKSDTEGAEWEMFEHCGGWIDRVQSIVIELHGAPLAKLEEHIGHDWTVLQHDTDTRYACETVALTRAAVAGH